MMKTKHRGCLSELTAINWLFHQGYEVFRNVSQHGPADLVAWDPENSKTLLIDVKTANRYVNSCGEVKFYFGSVNLEEPVRKLIVYGNEVIGWAEELKDIT